MRSSRLIPLFSLAFFIGFFPAISFAQGVAFTAATNFGAGVRPRFVAVGDFNGDGRQDLAVANQLSANVSILWATVMGPLARQRTLEQGLPRPPWRSGISTGMGGRI